jgi:hypothetical protein
MAVRPTPIWVVKLESVGGIGTGSEYRPRVLLSRISAGVEAVGHRWVEDAR